MELHGSSALTLRIINIATREQSDASADKSYLDVEAKSLHLKFGLGLVVFLWVQRTGSASEPRQRQNLARNDDCSRLYDLTVYKCQGRVKEDVSIIELVTGGRATSSSTPIFR